MARIVQKFGGTSVANIECIKNAALRVKAERDAGNEVVVVVSAMSGATNELIEYVNQIGGLCDAQLRQEAQARGSGGVISLHAQAAEVLSAWLGPPHCSAVQRCGQRAGGPPRQCRGHRLGEARVALQIFIRQPVYLDRQQIFIGKSSAQFLS